MRKRLAVWIGALALAAAIAAAIRLNRPQELVWWTSPPIDSTVRRVKALIPAGWEVRPRAGVSDAYNILPVDRRPKLLRILLPLPSTRHEIVIIHAYASKRVFPEPMDLSLARVDAPDGMHMAGRDVVAADKKALVNIEYHCNDLAAFEARYQVICNSVRVE